MKWLRRAFHLLCLGVVCLLPACHHNSSPSNPTPEPTANATTVVKDGVRFLLQTDKRLYRLGEPVQILCRATNNSNMTKHFTEGLEMVLRISNDYEAIWWHDNEMGIPSIESELSLAPHESIEQSFEWMMMHDNGTLGRYNDDFPVTAGAYAVTCIFRNYPEPLMSLSFQIQ